MKFYSKHLRLVYLSLSTRKEIKAAKGRATNHLVRIFHGFLEGLSLLANNEAFGKPKSLDESFDLSLKVLIAGVKVLENN